MMLRKRTKPDEMLELTQRMRDLLQEWRELGPRDLGGYADLERRTREAILDFHLAVAPRKRVR